MTVSEAAAALGVRPSTLRHQIKNRKLRAHKMGSTWYVSPLEVERYRAESLGRFASREDARVG
jgi:excisionase family DNA binding protein